MASGLEGLGRLVEPDEIVGRARYVLSRGGLLAGRRVVVSAGPTQEALDPVRYLSNHSSGKQGVAIAQAALDAGADVTLIAGPVALPTPHGAARIDVTDARSMRDAVIAHACGEPPADALIMAAAVADFRPASYSDHKIKKTENAGGAQKVISLEQNPDILLDVSHEISRPGVVIGFAAETHDLIANARGKLERKKLDLIVANDVTAPDAGFAVNTNRVLLIAAEGIEELPLMGKEAVAARLVSWLAERLAGSALAI
jgi:phosphopantothenoylcysteine decarboxylase/phosphopantothenate--cysteine ligase